MFQQSDTALKPSQNDSSLLDFSSLLLGVFILSFAAIFTRIAENELSPSATVFNRYYIATVVLVPWQIIQLRINNSSEPNQVIKLQDWAIFVLSSMLGTSAIFLWAQYRDWETDRKSTRLNSSHLKLSRMPSSA